MPQAQQRKNPGSLLLDRQRRQPASERPAPAMTLDDFLVWQADQDQLYEYIDGRPVVFTKMMTGTSVNHDRVTINALGHLFNQLRGGPCRPCTDDVAIRIESADRVRRPDLMIDCGQPQPKDTTAATPRLVMEVLSPGTRQIDLIQKLEEYKTVPELRVILLAEQDELHVACYHRDEQGSWQATYRTDPNAVIELPEIGVRLALADLYEGVLSPDEDDGASIS